MKVIYIDDLFVNMEQNIVDLINELGGKAEDFYSCGEVKPSKIIQAAQTLGVEFAKDFVEYVQKFGAIEVDDMELCGIDDDPDTSTVEQTQDMRDFSDFPMDCYVIESLRIDNIVIVQKSDGTVYQYAPGEDLELIANSLGEYLLSENDIRNKRSEYWKGSANV